MLGFFTSMDIGASGLKAQKLRMNTIANNMANISTTRDSSGNVRPYRRKIPIFSSGAEEMTGSRELGVRVNRVIEDNAPFRQVYNPDHPDANSEGYVQYPNVRMPIEMIDMIEASRAYEANIRSMEAAKSMISSALDIVK
mgnify:CR=1 FL=1